MLTELRIRDVGVIADAVVTPGPGFTAITGETGAGKTMVVTGISLLLGAKGEPRLIRRGAQRALIEGSFVVPPGIAASADEVGAELEDGELLVSRQIGPTRSRAFAGGTAVPVGVAAGLLADWVTLHGQSEQVRLGTSDRQREVLDLHGGAELAAVLDVYDSRYRARQRTVAELESLTEAARHRAQELDLLLFGLEEIEKADPQPGEDTALAAEAQRLQSIDDLRLAAGTALEAVAGTDDDLDAPQAIGLLAAARKAIEPAALTDPALEELGARLAATGYELADVAQGLGGYLADLDADPARLEWITGRRAALGALTRKYGADCDEVLAWAERSSARVTELTTADERIAELQQDLAALTDEMTALAARITALRTAAAESLANAAMAELAALAMPHAVLTFSLSPADGLGPHGADDVNLLFAANPGSVPGPLSRIASGGELSRVRLALEVVLAGDSPGRVFVFDEVDAGIGGAVAIEVGRRLADLARHSQVIVVTHLAQVAAFADRHFVVTKSSGGEVTTSGIVLVEEDERLAELARMMGGEATQAALTRAAELLSLRGAARAAR